jgi:predicted regulator of Ras-like GTPase activity (Roadblock/LC7/MglB family)
MHPARRLLRTLADVEGVMGSFLLTDSGALVATDLPATFDTAALAEAGPRIARLADLGGSYGEETRFLVIRFAEYKLYVRVLQTIFLGVLVTPAASMPALKAAASVVARRAEAMLVAEATNGPDTAPEAPHFDVDRVSTTDVTPYGGKRPSTRPPGAALSAPPSFTTTLQSMKEPDLEGSSPGAPSKRSIRYRGRSL